MKDYYKREIRGFGKGYLYLNLEDLNNMRVQKFFKRPSLTRQSFRDSCDVNKIIARFSKGREGDVLKSLQPSFNGLYGDFSAIPDLRVAIECVRRADEFFEALPASLRLRFDHSVEKFTDFCLDSKNYPELMDLGLIPKPLVSPGNSGEISPST